jgi:hypothetical protein
LDKPIKKYLIFSICFAGFLNCNIEIGNPDDVPGTSSGQKLSFNILSDMACETPSPTCAALPMHFDNDPTAAMVFEMTGAEFYLGNLQLLPNPAENIQKPLNLLIGDTVQLNHLVNEAQLTGTKIDFAPSANGALPAFKLQGFVSITSLSPQVKIPLTIGFTDLLQVQNSISADGAVFTGFVFDANTWFDFRNSSLNSDHLAKKLTSGPCADPAAKSCTQQKEMIAAKIAANIAKSAGIKKTAKGQQGK